MKNQRNVIKLVLLSVSAIIMMGIAIPDCGGAKALQQQIDELKTSNQQLKTKLMTMEGLIKSNTDEMNLAKGVLQQLTDATLGQGKRIDAMEESMKKAPPASGKKKR